MPTQVRSRTRSLVVAALFAAMIAVSALIAIPVGEVPFTLQTLVIVLVALVLPPEAAFAAVGTYVLAGAVGMPVFAGGKAGLAVLAGPTGGFLLGFALGALAGAAVRTLLRDRVAVVVADGAAAAAVLSITYAAGWAQLAAVTGMSGAEAFAAGVAPFVVIDAMKAAGAVAIATPLRRLGLA